jgi:predicted house-cleaning noncanonical NTP pyrophosphatase (MazG superfamily)
MISIPLYVLSEPTPADPIETIISIMIPIIFLLLLIPIVIALIREKRELLNNWNILIPCLSYSSKEFYDTLTAKLNEQEVKNLKVKVIEKNTGGILSGKRLYAEVSFDDYIYDVCGAPFGKSFFVSYWMHFELRKREKIVLGVPFFGRWLLKAFFPMTYYRVDTSNMFHSLMHEVIIELVDEICKDHELEKLSDNQKIPVMHDVFKR